MHFISGSCVVGPDLDSSARFCYKRILRTCINITFPPMWLIKIKVRFNHNIKQGLNDIDKKGIENIFQKRWKAGKVSQWVWMTDWQRSVPSYCNHDQGTRKQMLIWFKGALLAGLLLRAKLKGQQCHGDKRATHTHTRMCTCRSLDFIYMLLHSFKQDAFYLSYKLICECKDTGSNPYTRC